MSRPVMDYKLAHAIGWDAGNASMRKAGRTVWSEDDYNASVEAMNACIPEENRAWVQS